MIRVYKFLEAKWAIEVIRKKRLKKSLIPDLNDPWEGRPIILENNENRGAIDFLLKSLSLHLSLVCFSTSIANPLMWSHYGDNNRGIALGFDIPNPLDTDLFVREVQYREQPFRLMPENFDEGGALNHSFFFKILTTKYESWRYEKEVRMFAKISNPDPNNGYFFTPFSEQLRLREIVIGSRHADFGQVAECAAHAREMGDVTCFKVCPSDTEFKMVEDRTFYASNFSQP